MKINPNAQAASFTVKTHEGGEAANPDAKRDLERTVAACMLFENTFYESGNQIACRIQSLAIEAGSDFCAELAIKARHDLRIRHASLWLAVQMSRLFHGRKVGETISQVINRPDELTEAIAMYWKMIGRDPNATTAKKLPKQLKRGIALAFPKFDAYQLAKYNRDAAIKLKDAMFLCHPKPKDGEQEKTWKQLIDGTLAPPDTWEHALMIGKDRKATWERLIDQKKLGYMALLRNLRNMDQDGVDRQRIIPALLNGAQRSRALPFRFIAAANEAPMFAQWLSDAMQSAVKEHPRLSDMTYLVVDGSGSMFGVPISRRSKMDRFDAAMGLAVFAREVCDECRVFVFSESCTEVKGYRGLPLLDAAKQIGPGYGTYLGGALRNIAATYTKPDRIIVITDEQLHDRLESANVKNAYLINVGPYEFALPAKQLGWTRISGWSERIVDWILYDEKKL